jgi:hypothetical protein
VPGANPVGSTETVRPAGTVPLSGDTLSHLVVVTAA